MRVVLLLVLQLLILNESFGAEAKDFRGSRLIGFTNFNNFRQLQSRDQIILDSPRIDTSMKWNELVASWNLRGNLSIGFELAVRAIYPDRETEWYRMGNWTLNPGVFRRESVRDQKDENGTVLTDTLRLREAANGLQFRIIIRGTNQPSALAFVGISLVDTTVVNAEPLPLKEVWGKTLEVPQRSQVDYPEGVNEWCSPTSVSMMLAYWAEKTSRPELNHDVPAVAQGVNDPKWPGTGNWSFNMAFAGSHPGMRAYVARLCDISEIEQWIKAGVPIAASVRYGLLKGASEPGNGHLVVCVGFDSEGNVVVNDPGRGKVRQTYLRYNFVKSWAKSENTVYLLYPENHQVPENRCGHWFGGNSSPN